MKATLVLSTKTPKTYPLVLSSNVIKKLTSDSLIPSISKAKEIYTDKNNNNDDGEEEIRLKMHTPRIVSKDAHFAYTLPEKRLHYKTLYKSTKAYNDLQIDPTDEETEKLLDGEKIITTEEVFPYSLAYAGFQFGSFAGQLGDGRVVNLFDVCSGSSSSSSLSSSLSSSSSSTTRQTVQIKGAGKTPFSRFGDGKAVLRSSIREFVISETLHAIGIPSTRALQLTLLPGTKARRDSEESNGLEPCAQVTRFAPTWIRLGSFDLPTFRNSFASLYKLTNYCIDDVMPGDYKPLSIDCFNKNLIDSGKNKEGSVDNKRSIDPSTLTKYDDFMRQVIFLNAKSVGYWQTYGFLNGVLNTDNTSVLGLAIDFGPFSFIDRFDPKYTSNHDDVGLRYSFKEQPSAIWWNLTRMIQNLSVLIGSGPKYIDAIDQPSSSVPLEITQEMADYMNERIPQMISLFHNEYIFWCSFYVSQLTTKRLGLDMFTQNHKAINEGNIGSVAVLVNEVNKLLLEPLWSFLYETQLDYNSFFINFQEYRGMDFTTENNNGKPCYKKEFIDALFNGPESRGVDHDLVEYLSNPNSSKLSLSQKADYESIKESLDTWTANYSVFFEKYNRDVSKYETSKTVNPLFIPRSFMFEDVIDDYMQRQRKSLNDPKAEIDNSLLEKLFAMSTNPYDKHLWKSDLHPEVETKWLKNLAKPENVMKQCGCSS